MAGGRSGEGLAPLALTALTLGLGSLLASCTGPDPRALHKLACEQVATSVDLQSVGQLDALRKALGVAPDVDPLQTCRDLGVTMPPSPAAADQPTRQTDEKAAGSNTEDSAETSEDRQN
jgi:hypothetical protein